MASMFSELTGVEHEAMTYDDDLGMGKAACGDTITRDMLGPRDEKVTCPRCLKAIEEAEKAAKAPKPTVIWQGEVMAEFKTSPWHRRVKGRVVRRPDETLAFEKEEGTDAMGQTRWGLHEEVFPEFLTDVGRLFIDIRNRSNP